jgi:tetratricopeptide (TPR) repeat protein
LQAAGHRLEVISEQEFLERLGLEELSGGICGRYTLAQLTRLLNVPRARIQAWLRHGLIQATHSLEGLAVFDFRQVAAIKALSELKQSGVSTARLRKSLEQLSVWLPDAEDALLRLSAGEGPLLVRDEQGGLAEPNGQRRFEFDASDCVASDDQVVPLDAQPSPDELFADALQHEQAGRLELAAELYERWLQQYGPDARVCFNLGNVRAAMGKPQLALEAFRRAVELDAGYAEAWNNLGVALAQRGQREQAIAAFRQAMEHEPGYADALYNLADTLDELHRTEEAQRYWRAFLALAAAGPWADYARRRLATH